jgi:hypothetical protein
MNFDFITDLESRDFCLAIANAMAAKFAISREEAVKRINRLWVGTTFVGEDDLTYHRSEDEWVEHIYNFYEDRIRDGTADTPQEVLVEQKRQLWNRWQNRTTPDLPSDPTRSPPR